VAIALYGFLLIRGLSKKAPTWVPELLQNSVGKLDEVIENSVSNIITSTLTPDPESGLNLVDTLAARFGKGFRMSLLAQKSGQARHTKMIESRVFDAAKAKIPELQIGMQALESFGLGDLATPENIPALLGLAQKYGLLDMINAKGSGSSADKSTKNSQSSRMTI